MKKPRNMLVDKESLKSFLGMVTKGPIIEFHLTRDCYNSVSNSAHFL